VSCYLRAIYAPLVGLRLSNQELLKTISSCGHRQRHLLTDPKGFVFLGSALDAINYVSDDISGFGLAVRDELASSGLVQPDILFGPFARGCDRRAQRVRDNLPARRVSLGVLRESSMGLGFIGRLSLPRPRCYLSTIELSGPEQCGMLASAAVTSATGGHALGQTTQEGSRPSGCPFCANEEKW